MDVLTLVLTGFVAWSILVSLYFTAHRLGWVETLVIDRFPFRPAEDSRRVPVNLAIHFLAACIFTLMYTSAWSLIGSHLHTNFLGIAILTGLIHGAAVAIGMIVYTSRQSDGMQQAVLVVGAHGVFGLVIGVSAMMMQHNLGTLDRMAGFYQQLILG